MKNIFAFYGSLRVGEYNYKSLLEEQDGVEFIGTDTVHGYELRSLGAYPVILPSTEENGIVVDVFEINNKAIIQRIRSMELGAGYEEVSVLLPTLELSATIYEGGKHHNMRKDSYKLVPTGDWVKRHINNNTPNKVNEFV